MFEEGSTDPLWEQEPLLARVFQIDVTVCPDCGGRMKIIAALTARASVQGYLEGVGLPSRAPPIAPARIEPQLEFDEAAWHTRQFSGRRTRISATYQGFATSPKSGSVGDPIDARGRRESMETGAGSHSCLAPAM